MKIDWTKSGLTKGVSWILYVVFVVILLFNGRVAYNKSWNADRRMGTYFALASGDEASYLGDMEHYIQTGHYGTLDLETKNVGRGPYYAIPYFFFRQFLSVQNSYDALIILHILCFALAILMLMKVAEPYLKYKSLVWIIPLCILGLSMSMSFLTRLQTEMITITELVLFAYFYSRFNKSKSILQLMLAALFLSMAAVIKPYLLPIFAICFFDWVITNKIWNWKLWTQYVGIMSLPLIIICLPFTIRNAVKLHTFAPMQNTMYAGSTCEPVDAAMRSLVRTWGELHVEWDERAMGTFLMPIDGYEYKGELPQHIFKGTNYTYQDIYELKELCYQYQHMEESSSKDSLRVWLISTMNLYKSQYKNAHPLWRIRATMNQGRYLLSKGTFAFNHQHHGLRHLVSNFLNLFKFSMRYIVFVLSLIGLVLIAIKERHLRFITWIVVYIILFFSCILAGESRFYMLGDYYGLIGLVYLIDRSFLKKRGVNGGMEE